MAKIESRPKLTMEIALRLNEAEAGALDALVGYGIDSFLEVFYKHMGEAYLKPYESGLRSLFESVRTETGIRSLLDKADKARALFNGDRRA